MLADRAASRVGRSSGWTSRARDGRPRVRGGGSRVNISVATFVSRSWLLRNETTRWRVSLTTVSTASSL